MKSDQFWSRMTTDDFTVWTSKQQRLKPQAYILNTFHTDYHLLEHVIAHVSNLECNRMIIPYNLYELKIKISTDPCPIGPCDRPGPGL